MVTAGRGMQSPGTCAECVDRQGVPHSWQGQVFAPDADAPMEQRVAAFVTKAARSCADIRSRVLGTTAEAVQDSADGMEGRGVRQAC